MDTNWSGEKWYIDTHAGTGYTTINDRTTIDGSAIIAFDNYVDSFDKFYFYELNEESFHTLHEALSERFGCDFDVSPARLRERISS
jgi:23S rRNA A2030 N6-methylase RlmJ